MFLAMNYGSPCLFFYGLIVNRTPAIIVAGQSSDDSGDVA
jgi:hypothetical protein